MGLLPGMGFVRGGSAEKYLRYLFPAMPAALAWTCSDRQTFLTAELKLN